MLTELEQSGEAENTIVIVWGDHGWHLGDQRVWGKHTLMESSLRSTLIVKAPHARKAIKNCRIVSSVDIYPTLMELCDIPAPEGLDGHSFMKLLNVPDERSWQEAAYSYFNNGISVRTPKFRLTRYGERGKYITELYDYRSDELEKRNTFDTGNKRIIRKLMDIWEKGQTLFK